MLKFFLFGLLFLGVFFFWQSALAGCCSNTMNSECVNGYDSSNCNYTSGSGISGRVWLENGYCDPATNQCTVSEIGPSEPAAGYDSMPIKIKLNTAIPGLEEFSQGEGVVINNESLAKYIGGLYKFFIGIAGILAVVMIMFGGIQWLTSGGDSTKIGSAKETIFGAVIGLILALTSFTILRMINPELVSFGGLNVTPVPVTQNITPNQGECLSDYQVENIPQIPNVVVSSAVSDPRLMPETIAKLRTAASLLAEGEQIKITSAYRTTAKQRQLYDCYINKRNTGNCAAGCDGCNEAAAPACTAPHQTGKAIDACLMGGSQAGDGSCSGITALYNGDPRINQDQIYLQEIMARAGFSRYCREWWHFESTQMSLPCPPGLYNSSDI